MDSADNVRNGTDRQAQVLVDGAAEDSPASKGVSLADLEPLTTVLVRTANSLYRIIVLRGTTVLVRGGRSFPEIASADIFSFGVNVVRFGWIGVGLRMELHSGCHCVVTSPVRSFTIERRSAAARPQ